jgi:hypothetical protein
VSSRGTSGPHDRLPAGAILFRQLCNTGAAGDLLLNRGALNLDQGPGTSEHFANHLGSPCQVSHLVIDQVSAIVPHAQDVVRMLRGIAALRMCALARLRERAGGTAWLEQAVDAFRGALQEMTREHVPLDWAMMQNDLGTALQTLGARESGTTRLEQAAAAYRDTLQEMTGERVPLQWAVTQNNLAGAQALLNERLRAAGE